MLSRLLRPAPALPERDRLDLPGDSIEYRIRTSDRRRTLALRIETSGALTVSAPAALPLQRIRDFVASRRDWIQARRQLFASCSVPPLLLVDGAQLPCLGTSLELVVQAGSAARCRREADRLVVQSPDGQCVRRALEAWYRRMAVQHFAERVAHFAPRVGRGPASVVVRGQRRRWGSCSARGTVSLNWRLLQAAPEVVDYVIVHELCHLLVPNHSPRFWAEVSRVLPGWREHRRALREFGRALTF